MTQPLPESRPHLTDTLRVYTQPNVLRMLFLGFSSGLPLLLVLGTMGFWLREAGIDLKTIGFMSWVGLIYAMKWAWAPFVDSVYLPLLGRLGRRKSWLLLSQIGLIVTFGLLAFADPSQNLSLVALLVTLAAFASATQDIALDAYRIESAPQEEQAALAATYQTGYRVAMIWAGAGALALAAFAGSDAVYDVAGWHFAYAVMAASFLPGMVIVLFSREPVATTRVNPFAGGLLLWFKNVAVTPFTEFFHRFGRFALTVLLLIATYRISDIVMGVMANPFYFDLGFTKEEVAAITKVFGIVMTLTGAFIGGVIALRIGVLKTLFLGAVLSAATNLLFAWLGTQGHSLTALVLTISADNLASGIASVAFVAYLSGLTNVAYTATQYALFSSVMLLFPKFLAGFSGIVVEAVGYSTFFCLTAVIGIPVMALVWLVARRTPNA
ncbi:MAG TPA: AmpG family muropeptide MFS transporter [Sutterella sp.]|nr:AmpG family muropeptide MFS transporter [Sutterella sp.]